MRSTVSTLLVATVVASAHILDDVPWMNRSETPLVRARKLAAAMTLAEQLALLHGSCHEWPRPPGVLGYTGRVCANKRLGIPELRLNDGPVGFRCSGCAGSTTAWPSALTVAAGFDKQQAHAWGVAMGQEWYDKGANVLLGPGVNLARLPNNGRLWEYVSGEDPYLGYHMAASVVAGIQSQGVIATAKHYVDNSQETNRDFVIEVVDERTQFEIYYPPFEGAISAGLGAIMCAYNKVCIGCDYANASKLGKYNCESHPSLQRDLKGRLHHTGLVMSDWDATHSSASLTAGLDLEMNSAGEGKFLNESVLNAMLANGTLARNTSQSLQ